MPELVLEGAMNKPVSGVVAGAFGILVAISFAWCAPYECVHLFLNR